MNFIEWQALTEAEQFEVTSGWSPYDTSEIDSLLNDIVAAFRAEYPHFETPGMGNVHGNLMLVVIRPFIFDMTASPNSFMGLAIRYTLKEPEPAWFEINREYFWAPENYLNFVNNHAIRIRAELGKPNMNREEMLAALIGMTFDDWIGQCIEFGPGHTEMVPGQREL